MILRTSNGKFAATLAICGLVVAGCGDDSDDAADAGSDESGATVVVTTSIWADVIAEATCAEDVDVDVVTLVPADADPHSFEPSLQDRETLDGADLVVANGLDLEAGYADLLSTVDDDRFVEVASLDEVDVRDGGEHEHEAGDHEQGDHEEGDHEEGDHAHDDGHEHDHDDGDPHLWMDPLTVSAAVHPLADAVAAATGADAEAVAACADDYADELDALDGDIAEQIDAVPADQRVLVTNHDAYGYFADRYGLEIIGTILPSTSTLAETNPADLDDLRAEIEETGARAIVVDAEHASDDADALADAIEGIEVVALYNGGLGDHGTYIDMMRSNATAIADALGG